MSTEYALDTARAKTPAERLRIVADLMEAKASGADVHLIGADGCLHPERSYPLACYATNSGYRYVTKRRPALVIPAIELFEGPVSQPLAFEEIYYAPDPTQSSGVWKYAWFGRETCLARLRSGLCFRNEKDAAAIGLHIRNALAKAVAR
jgi:hypothetical protein